jgi:hypothetical protein
MKLLEPVSIESCSEHLRRLGSGVPFNLTSMPNPADGYAAFLATLEDSDVDRIFL